ncbi:hypothetical protein N658DRAFT_549597 [Parathielavia hyrcaniae]|uniref:Ectomycorrhiza-upregulated zf-mynd domain-containing protein n=1 Tax=Parathielavia hyrcaniae TaxID=113614 RepID=A0AAN6Q938_9PEZI|nr:hypothetical protein N658DRAFT_549597 [Parathielavia hyrcaniae]
MPPIDYSKWDNIDTDSETEDPQQPKQPAPISSIRQPVQEDKPASASNIPQPAPAASSTATPTQIQGVIVRCDMEKGRHAPWSKHMLPSDHTLFKPPFVIPDIPRLIEIPLVMYRLKTQSGRQEDLDNQIITYININAESGFAAAQWQSHVGTVVVARADKKPLLPHHLEGVWIYCDMILDRFGEGEGPPRRLYNRKAFEAWWGRCCEEQKGFRNGTGGEDDPDDWTAVRSPYEV